MSKRWTPQWRVKVKFLRHWRFCMNSWFKEHVFRTRQSRRFFKTQKHRAAVSALDGFRFSFSVTSHPSPAVSTYTHTHTPVTPFPPAVRVRLLEIPLLLQHTFHIPEYSGISTPISNNICDHTVCIHRHTNTHTHPDTHLIGSIRTRFHSGSSEQRKWICLIFSFFFPLTAVNDSLPYVTTWQSDIFLSSWTGFLSAVLCSN